MKKVHKKNSNVEEVKIVVFGTGGVGKSALIVQLIQNVFVEQYDPTLEDSYRKETTIDDKPVIMDILDTAGQEEFQSLRDQYVRQGEGYIIVFSITNKTSFDEVEQFIDQILSAKDMEEMGKKAAIEIPLVIIGNKCDLKESRVVSEQDIKNLCEKYGGIRYFEASAKTRTNVDEAFMDCTKQIFEKVKSKKIEKGKCLIQ